MREVALNVVEDLAVVALHVDGLAVVALHVDGLAVVALNVDEDLDFAPPNLMREVALNVVEDLDFAPPNLMREVALSVVEDLAVVALNVDEISPLSEVVRVLVRGESAVPELGLDLGRIVSARCGVVG